MTEAEFLTSLEINDGAFLYRQAHNNSLIKGERYPNASLFSHDPTGLSTNWNELATPEHAYHIIGLSYRFGKAEFKNCRQFSMFKIPVTLLKEIEAITKIHHTPVLNGNPAAVGTPNIYCHASIVYEDDTEVRLKVSDYCKENIDVCECLVDMDKVEQDILELRKQGDNNAFHRLDLM
jgi:hypothetical protein